MSRFLLIIIYLAFISLGLPDALLGAAWPMMYPQFEVPISYAGAISMLIAGGTIVSSLLCERLTIRFGTGKITFASVLMTAAALFGFSFSRSFWQLLLWAVPYGLGAGSVDASLNNYVALHYAGRHMSWLHAMWGLGAAAGPYVMGYVLQHGQPWNAGYRIIGIIQVVLTILLFLTLPLWRRNKNGSDKGDGTRRALSLREIMAIPGVLPVVLVFFGYCAVEQTTGLWAASYLVLNRGISSETASAFAGLFFAGIMIGRFLSGFLTFKWNDKQMIYLGFGIILSGIICLTLLEGEAFALAGLLLIGLGCAPIYPCLIHATPLHFGAWRSQAVIGVQMAGAYVGTSLMPPFFGLIARHIDIGLFPLYMLFFLALMFFMYRLLLYKTKETAAP